MALAIVLTLAWLAWFSVARLPVIASTEEARLETEVGSWSIEPSVAGEVVSNRMFLGQSVTKGEPLFILDSTVEQSRLQAALERQSSLAASIREFQLEIEALRSAAAISVRRDGHARRQIEYLLEAEKAAAAASVDEEKRLRSLQLQGLASELELFKAQAESQQALALVDSKAEEVELQSAIADSTRANQTASLKRAQRELLEVESLHTEVSAQIEELRDDIDRKAILAPISGIISDVSPIGPGAFVEAGNIVAHLLQEKTDVRLVAWFETDVKFGPIRPGQAAKVWLDSRPKGFGEPLAATVTAVASEPHFGRLRVELEMATRELSHGQTAHVEVEVARVRALTLALQRFVGHDGKRRDAPSIEAMTIDSGRTSRPNRSNR